ncbi:SOS response-associated peptidase family protein [Falsiroseomonas sp. HW251]|uniref:SOS response-associated peptidase family protein n=1 Tax=Falsiroseomonas sp. HW251 TaxID=3390998 RepID=UPI003D310A5C
MPRGVLLGELSFLGAPPYRREPGEHCFVVARQPETGDAMPTFLRWGLDVADGSQRRLQFRADQLAGRRLAGMARCIVPVSGFARLGPRRTCIDVTLTTPTSLAAAAVWTQDAGGPAFAIITAEAGDDLHPMLVRTPVLLAPAAWPRWLADGPLTGAALAAVARPVPAAWLRIEQRKGRLGEPSLSVARQVEEWAPGSLPLREPVLRFGPRGRRAATSADAA